MTYILSQDGVSHTKMVAPFFLIELSPLNEHLRQNLWLARSTTHYMSVILMILGRHAI